MGYSLPLDLYFWLIDRAGLKDDPRNQVVIEENRVQLHRDYSTRLDNGIHFQTLMQAIRKTANQKQAVPMSFDQ